MRYLNTLQLVAHFIVFNLKIADRKQGDGMHPNFVNSDVKNHIQNNVDDDTSENYSDY